MTLTERYDQFLGTTGCMCETCHPERKGGGTDDWQPRLKDFESGQGVRLSDSHLRTMGPGLDPGHGRVMGVGARLAQVWWELGFASWVFPGNLRHEVRP